MYTDILHNNWIILSKLDNAFTFYKGLQTTTKKTVKIEECGVEKENKLSKQRGRITVHYNSVTFSELIFYVGPVY